MASSNKRFVILTGPPGVGKTTIVKKLTNKLLSSKSQIKVQGFYTEEVRENGTRAGFDVVTLDNKRAPLAKVNSPNKGPTVGKYTVDVSSFERICSPLLDNANAVSSDFNKTKESETLMVIDEIGKMELFSNIFKKKVLEIISRKQLLLATIPVDRGASVPLLTALRSSPHTQLFTVTRTNRDCLPDDIFQFIMEITANDHSL